MSTHDNLDDVNIVVDDEVGAPPPGVPGTSGTQSASLSRSETLTDSVQEPGKLRRPAEEINFNESIWFNFQYYEKTEEKNIVRFES